LENKAMERDTKDIRKIEKKAGLTDDEINRELTERPLRTIEGELETRPDGNKLVKDMRKGTHKVEKAEIKMREGLEVGEDKLQKNKSNVKEDQALSKKELLEAKEKSKR